MFARHPCRWEVDAGLSASSRGFRGGVGEDVRSQGGGGALRPHFEELAGLPSFAHFSFRYLCVVVSAAINIVTVFFFISAYCLHLTFRSREYVCVCACVCAMVQLPSRVVLFVVVVVACACAALLSHPHSLTLFLSLSECQRYSLWYTQQGPKELTNSAYAVRLLFWAGSAT